MFWTVRMGNLRAEAKLLKDPRTRKSFVMRKAMSVGLPVTIAWMAKNGLLAEEDDEGSMKTFQDWVQSIPVHYFWYTYPIYSGHVEDTDGRLKSRVLHGPMDQTQAAIARFQWATLDGIKSVAENLM
jgi:hypothetical protein